MAQAVVALVSWEFVATLRGRERNVFRLAAASVMLLAALVLYTQSFFDGFGRLQLLMVVAAPLLLYNWRHPRRRHRVLVLVALPLAIAVAAAIGQVRSPTDRGSPIDVTSLSLQGDAAGGLDSLVTPLSTFSELTETTVEPRLGATYAEAFTFFVPGGAWPGKPVGFGRQLTEWLRPGLLDTTHSMAALFTGEAYANFGWVGVGVVAVVLGFAVRRFDAYVVRRQIGTDLRFHPAVLVHGALGVTSFYWVGLFTFLSRTVVAAVICWSVLTLVRRWTPDSKTTK